MAQLSKRGDWRVIIMKDHYYNSIGRVRQLLSPSLGLRDDYKHALSYNFVFFLASYIPCRFCLFLLVNFQ